MMDEIRVAGNSRKGYKRMEIIEEYMKECAVSGDTFGDREGWKGKIRVGHPIFVDKGEITHCGSNRYVKN